MIAKRKRYNKLLFFPSFSINFLHKYKKKRTPKIIIEPPIINCKSVKFKTVVKKASIVGVTIDHAILANPSIKLKDK